METQTVRNGVYYNHTLKDDKHFFGGFANLAINNLNSLIKAFIIKFNLNENLDYTNFNDVCFSDKISDYDFEMRVKFLKAYFPVAHHLDIKNRENLKKQLKLLFDVIDSIRSFYTHYYHAPISFKEELFILLNDIFVMVTNDVKLNKVKDDKSRHILSKSLSEELEIRYREQFEKLKQLKREGKKVNLNDKAAIMNAVLNSAFQHLVYKDTEGNLLVTRRYESKYSDIDPAENGIMISQSGLLFILSFFLRRKENEDLKSRVKGFKGKIIKEGEEKISGLKFMATHWVFSYLSFKDVKQSLNTDFGRETLLLQIVDELSKVPDEVYCSFDKETQESFIEDINEYLNEGKTDYTLEVAKVIHPIIRKRYENKFNYFALRYLSEFAGFERLRFQLHLGNYIHDKREKMIGGTELSTDRFIKERIKVFGKLSDAYKLKNEFFSNQERDKYFLGWELLPNPSYIIIDNNVPIYLPMDKDSKEDVRLAKEERRRSRPEERKRRSADKKQKFAIVDEINKMDLMTKGLLKIDEPTAFLSMNEIPALLYELLHKNKSTKQIEELLKAKISERIKTIKNYNPNSPLPASTISKRIRHNTNSKVNVNVEKVLKLLKTEILSADKKLDLIFKNRKELTIKVGGKFARKFIFGLKELGKEATWLADDIKRFMPNNTRMGWKSYQHSQLQYSLAFYDSRPKEAYHILEETWDFNNDNDLWSHWIKSAFLQKSFDRFYEQYLTGKKSYLQSVLDNLEGLKNESKKILSSFIEDQLPKNFFDRRLYMLDSLDDEKNKILSNPLVFPRGLFDLKPTFKLGKTVQDYPKEFAEWYSYGYSNKHSFQKFYLMDRDYNLLFEKQWENKVFNEDFTREKGFEIMKMKQDLRIKNVKIQDLFLKLIAEKLYKDVFNHDITLELCDLYLSQKERFEKEKVALKQSQREIGDKTANIINDNFIWSKTVPFNKDQIAEKQIKLKDLGKFRYFLNDSKIQKLFSYDTAKIWSKEQIENEVSVGAVSYESIRRENFFKEIQNLEKHILSFYPAFEHPKELELKNNPNFKMYIVNGFLRKKVPSINDSESDWLENLKESDFSTMNIEDLILKDKLLAESFLLILIRNKFAHNQLPDARFYKHIIEQYPNCSGQTAAETFFNFVKYMKLQVINF